MYFRYSNRATKNYYCYLRLFLLSDSLVENTQSPIWFTIGSVILISISDTLVDLKVEIYFWKFS